MKNYGLFIAVLFAVVAGGALFFLPSQNSASQKISLEDIKPYIGAYPFDKIKKISLVEIPSFKSALTDQVGPRVLHRFETLVVGTPLTQEQNYLNFGACKQHDCPSENYTVWINAKTGVFYTCYFKANDQDFENEVQDGKKFWFGIGKKYFVSASDTDNGCNLDPKEMIKELDRLLSQKK